MIVMRIAITPSLNASSLCSGMVDPGAARGRSRSHPPRKGAIAAETPVNPAHVPIAPVRSPGRKAASMIARRDGDHGGVDPGHRRPQDHRRDHPPAWRGAVAEQFARAGAVSRAQLALLSARIWWSLA
jgi:hypothetical protein